jgi:hypothetical protein
MEDVKINVKIKLSALWIAAMFCYLYADVLAYMAPGHLAEILTGEIGGIPINDLFLVAGALFMVPPIIMIFLSLILSAKANRWINIIVGIIYTLVGIGMVFMASNVGYVVYGIVESVLTALIVGFAWMWPKQED